jgi:large subunit ribosomal protein L21
MFAVIQTGGKQVLVRENRLIRVEKIEGDLGKTLSFTPLLVSKDGNLLPAQEGANVVCEIVNQERDPKVIIFKKKRRHNYRRKKGHRQHRTVLRVIAIEGV